MMWNVPFRLAYLRHVMLLFISLFVVVNVHATVTRAHVYFWRGYTALNLSSVETWKFDATGVSYELPEASGNGQIGDRTRAELSGSNLTRYHSSDWEKLWLTNIRTWQNHGICQALAAQKEQVRHFMNDTCSARSDTSWCLIDDSIQKFWYNTLDGRIQVTKPFEVRHVSEIQGMVPKNTKIWSWFERTDMQSGTVNYDFIEPLVGHLRHPLARCASTEGDLLLVDRSYVLPGITDSKQKSFLFDAGASAWNKGAGGPSLSYFANVWKRYGFNWGHIEAWEGTTPSASFYDSVPTQWRNFTTYHQEWISTSPLKSPFLPSVIKAKTLLADYVVFKLDIDSKSVESAIVDYMLRWKYLDLIDEFLWEHHVDNYLMEPYWGSSQDMSKSIADSYEYFLELRVRGVRSHSWV
mmetsp:Transcript_81006/g.131255  ORF Transcript_81006/g.131255 Transcript_81006/m.131255 type:complete len:409 (-) Transcript_81006:1172-2398(-)